MTRITALLRRDIVGARRDSMALYTLFSIPMLCLALRLILPNFGQVGADVVVTPEVNQAIGAELSKYVTVHEAGNEGAVRDKVLTVDDWVGVVPNASGGYQLVRQGNETEEARELSALALRAATGDISVPPDAGRDVGDGHNAIVDWGGVFVGLMAIYLAVFLMAFGVVEDQEQRVIQALGVTPMSRREYVAARSVLAGGLAVVLAYSSILILGAAFDPAKLLVIAAAGIPLTLLFGFTMAMVSPTITAAMANFKFVNLFVIAPPLISFMVPERLEKWVLGWNPAFWAFRAYREIVFGSPSWADVAPEMIATFVMGLIALSICYPLFRKRLQFALS